ncbi:RodZ domain-containing protein [Pseudoalteromonas ulvae]|uniref:Cytoskeleton protein RodZ-like C-terminal domain-containing protein n=1 Tax=Pseudoalteromonas ulvae TaxID=107327 RepID=A0A244CNC2_PSEDV|nr:RodZ domain-containing protein [Pseudoalteromonas ulvae]OUL57131.1 hypothetical protein B1199_13215 [Pseudoalteromonas ulvae]
MKEKEVTEQTHIEPSLPLVGHFLTEGREAAGISVDEFAKRLNLTSAQLIALENNQLQGLGPAIFIKGYIKSYCKFLNLEESYLLDLYEAQIGAPAATKMQSFSRRTEKEAHDNRLMFVSYAVLVLVIGLTVLWWWQNKEPAQSVELPATVEQSETATEMQSKDNAMPDELFVDAKPETAENKQIVGPSAKVPDEIIHARDEAFSASQPVTLEINPAEVVAEQPVLESSQSAALTVQEGDQNQVVMHFRGDSWVEIFDASAARVAFGVKKAGYTMTVTGEAPFSVVLGKHHLVDIQLDGQAVDISDFPTNRLAKFNLPLTE